MHMAKEPYLTFEVYRPEKSVHVTPSLNPSPRGRDVLRHCRDGKYIIYSL